MRLDERELLPLGSGFDVVRRGYDRAQVEEHLDRLDADLRILAADRDAAVTQAGEFAGQLRIAQARAEDLRQQVDRLACLPTTMEGLNERLQRMLRLAREEVRELQANAEADVARMRDEIEAADRRARTDRDQRLAELEQHWAEMQAEHRRLVEEATAEADRIRREAAAEQARVTEEIRVRHAQVEQDFAIAMASRRTESMRELAKAEAASKVAAGKRIEEAAVEAHRRVREATAEALRRTTEAEHQVDVLRTLRGRLAAQLQSVHALLFEVPAQIQEMADEEDVLADATSGAPATRPAPSLVTGDHSAPHPGTPDTATPDTTGTPAGAPSQSPRSGAGQSGAGHAGDRHELGTHR